MESCATTIIYMVKQHRNHDEAIYKHWLQSLQIYTDIELEACDQQNYHKEAETWIIIRGCTSYYFSLLHFLLYVVSIISVLHLSHCLKPAFCIQVFWLLLYTRLYLGDDTLYSLLPFEKFLLKKKIWLLPVSWKRCQRLFF
jgi:hypothetical protein